MVQIQGISREQKALIVSALGALVMACFAVYMSWYTSSDAILLDGIFNLLSAFLTIGSLAISILLGRGYTKRHPLGFYAYEALMVLVKGLCILGLVIIAIVSNLTTLLEGGREPHLVAMIWYGIPALLINILVWFYCVMVSKRTKTGLIEAECRSWTMNAAITAIILCSLVVVFFLRNTSLGFLSRYIDQILVIVLCFLTFMEPIDLITSSFKELMLQSVTSSSGESFQHVLERHPAVLDKFTLKNISVFKIGRGLWLFIDIRRSNDTATLDDFIAIRKNLISLAKESYTNVALILSLVD